MNKFKEAWEIISPQGRAKKAEYNKAVSKMVDTIKRQHSLYRHEIKEWRVARYLAKVTEDPRRKRIIDLYEEIMCDPFIFGRWQTRMLRVSNKELVILDAEGNTDIELTKLLQKGWARQLTKYNLESIPYGYTLPYIKELNKEGFIKSVDMIYRDHVVPETCEVLKSPEDKNGYDFTTEEYSRWMYFVNNTHTLGLLDKAAPLYIFKKHSWQNWDEFEEKFGLPMRIAKVASKDPKVLKEIDKWLKDLGSAAYARFPEGTELDIKETSTTDAYNVFNEKRKACNEELATLFDGHFETAKDSGSRAKAGSIIESTQDMITKDDEAFNLDIWNDTILPMLTVLGYPFSSDNTVGYNENVVSTPKERLEIFMGVKKLGFLVKKEQIETELDVEIEPMPEPPKPDDKKTRKNKLENFKQPHNHSNGCGAHLEDYRVINADVVYSLTPQEEKLLKAIYAGNINWDYNEFKATHGELLKALKKGFGNFEIDYNADNHKMMAMMRTNVHRFGMDKTTAEIFQLNQILKDPDVDSYAKFRDRALKVFPNYKQYWLKTEYQQAFVTSQMGARYHEMMDDIEDAPYWRLNAVLDDGTTDICRSLDGKVFRKDNPDTWQFMPANHWRCRSDAEDVLDSYEGEVLNMDDAIGLDPDGWEGMQKSGHNVNWGDTGQVFTAAQSYLKKVSAVPLDVDSLSYKDFGLSDTFKTALKLPKKNFKWDAILDTQGQVPLTDFSGLPRWVNPSLFSSLDRDAINTLPKSLLEPDEVYWRDIAGMQQYWYLKSWEGFVLQILVEFSRTDAAQIKLINKLTNPNPSRKGLLIHSKK